ncbi:UbiX family flavin prenyltransferase [Orbaceae bacterium ac157xtp]
MKKIIVAITGATGAPLAVKVLQLLNHFDFVEVHLIVSEWGKKTLISETNLSYKSVCDLATEVHNINDQSAVISSGSFKADGMIVVPCSMKTLASIRHGFAQDLISRAADVTIKEQRKLILVPRETPLSQIHLENLTDLAKMGVTIIPPVPAFYNQPKTIDDILTHLAIRILDQLQLEHPYAKRWQGFSKNYNE